MGSAPLVLLAAGLTGAATLAAEMLWIRGLGRGIGTTFETVAMVAGLFLAGLGLGALLGARAAARSARPARRGAWLLAGAGTWTALSPLYVHLLPDLRASLFAPENGGVLPALLLEAPLILPAALCFGAVFPLLVRARVADVAHAGSRTAGVYAANTAGAVAGVVLILPLLLSSGETMTLRLVGAASLLGALLLLLADKPLPHGEGPPAPVTPGQTLYAGGLSPALFASGAAALLAQMAWLRMLQPLAGPHLYGVALLLAPLLLALAVGAAVAGPLADRMRRPSLLVPALLAAAGAFVLLSLPAAGGAPFRVTSAAASDGSRPWALVSACLLAVAPATLVFGALLPAAVRLRAAWSGNAARPAGRLYAWNALGALAGSLLAGYLLLPRFGAERTLFVAAVLLVAAAIVLRWRVPSARRQLAAVAHAVPLLALALPGLLPAWLASGPTTAEVIAAGKPVPPGLSLEDSEDFELYTRWFAGRRAQKPGDTSGEALPVFEGRGGRVVLIEEADGRIGLRRGSLRESVFDPDRPDTPGRTEYALGLLPALLHAKPERALVIGHGAGWTAEALLAAGAGRVDVAEIDDAVLAAARAARGLRRLPAEAGGRAHLISADGRVLLRAAAAGGDAGRYDVIASQPSHPWHPASGHLFTKEAYAAAHDALRPGGVHAQWLNLFDMTPALLRSALASYRFAFDEVWVFRFPGELVLLGFRAAPELVAGRWEAFFSDSNPRADAARAAGLVHAGDLFKHFLLDTAALARLLPPGVEPLTDDVPRLEFGLAARRLRAAGPEDVDAELLAAFPPDIGAALPHERVRERWLTDGVHGWLREGGLEEASLWSRAVRWGFSADGRMAQAHAALAADEPERAETIMRAARESAPERGDVAALWVHTAIALIGKGTRQDQHRRSEEADALVERMPTDGRVLAAVASMKRTAGDVPASRALFERAVDAEGEPPPDGVRVRYARLLLSEAYGPAEEKRALELLAADPGTYTEVDSLDMLLRMLTVAGDEGRAAEVEQTLATLQRTRGLALLRSASGALAQHRFGAALLAARACAAVWPARAEPFELWGLTALAHMAIAAHEGLAAAEAEQEALEAFLGAIERSKDPEAARGRARRMLRWYGRDPSQVDARPEGDAE